MTSSNHSPARARLRVLHCPDVVGGHAPLLARAERNLGTASWAVALEASPYAYEVDETLFTPGERVRTRERKRACLLRRAMRDFDVVHFNFGSSLFPAPEPNGRERGLKPLALRAYYRLMHMQDLALLKAFGKAIFVTYQGDDARQGDYCRAHFPIHFAHEVGPEYYPAGSDAVKRKSIERFARYADRIYALNPDLLYVLPKQARFLPYCSVDLQEWRLVEPPSLDGPLKVVHAPSHRVMKGTRYLIEAVERLKREGATIELVLVENVTRQKAREVYEKADVVVDQLLAGWYGGLAVEVMALGKPVVAYIREGDLALVPEEMRVDLPIINATPSSIEAVLRSLVLQGRPSLHAMGRRGRAYVEKWHQPAQIAARVIADYRAALHPRRLKDERRVG